MIRNIGIAIASVLVMCLALEAILRVTHLWGARVSWTEPDARIGWRFTPGHEYWFFQENDHPITGRINSHGWRDRERTVEKSRGSRRVAVIGDSFVEAFQVELDSTYCAIAERELSARCGFPVEVMNFGRSGMTITEERMVMESEVARFAPDVIVLVFVPDNDIADMRPATSMDRERPYYAAGSVDTLDSSFNTSRGFRLRQRLNPLKQRSALVSLLATRYNMLRQNRAAGGVAMGGEGSRLPGFLTLCTDSPDAVHEENFRLWERAFDAAASWCDARGIDLILMSTPATYRSASLAEIRVVAPKFRPECIDERLAGIAAGRNVMFIGLQQPFRALHEATGDELSWSHFNYAGHRLAADRMGEGLERAICGSARP